MYILRDNVCEENYCNAYFNFCNYYIISFRRKDIFSQNRAKDAGLKIFQMSLLTISEERLVFRLKYIRQSRKYQKYVAR